MSVLVKGMEMPKACSECRLLEGDSWYGLCHGANRWLDDDDFFSWYQYPEGDIDDSKPVNCPLVEVPTPHGRLVDADAMVGDDNEAYKTAQLALMGAGSGADAMRMVYEVAHKNLQMFIADAPTVIEAEGPKE